VRKEGKKTSVKDDENKGRKSRGKEIKADRKKGAHNERKQGGRK